MRAKVSPNLLINEEYPVDEYSSPERRLLFSLLERALRDLEHSERLVRMEAVQWFCTWKNSRKEHMCFSYKDVRDEIDLKQTIVEEIKKKVHRAMMDELI